MRDTLSVVFVEVPENAVDPLLAVLRTLASLVRHEAVQALPELDRALARPDVDLVLLSAAARECTVEQVREGLDGSGSLAPIIGLCSGHAGDLDGRVLELLDRGATDAVSRRNVGHLRHVVVRELANLDERRQRRRSEAELLERERQWGALLASSRDPIAYVHAGMHIHANRAYLDMFGFEAPSDLASVPLMDLVAHRDQTELRDRLRRLDDAGTHTELEVNGLRLDGNALQVKFELSEVTYESERCVQLVVRDRSEALAVQAQLDYLRTRDPVTGLFNRAYFVERLKPAVTATGDEQALLVYVEIDGFNTYREQIGLEAADRVMASVAQALSGGAGSDLLIARFGDGTFVALATSITARAIRTMLRRLVTATEGVDVVLDEHEVVATCTMGATHFRAGVRSPQSVVRKAQQACREIRESGSAERIRLKRQLQPVHAREGRRVSMNEEVVQALDGDRASLVFQPIMALRDDTKRIYEVFLRLVDETGRELPPNDVFGDDLDDRLAERLDRFVISSTVELAHNPQVESQGARFFVNLSGQAMLDNDLLEFVTRTLADAEVAGNRLVIEIGEALAVTHAASVKAFISGINALGCHAALEHFGAGICSIGSMRQIPVDFVKIDQSLVTRATREPEAEAALRSIVEIAHALHREIVAFGVEDSETLAKMWTLGVDYAQGNAIQAARQELGWEFMIAEEV